MNWQHYFNRHMRVGAGVEMPKASYTQISPEELGLAGSSLLNAATSHQYTPNFPLYVAYHWGSGHVRLAALIRNIHYIDFITGEGHDEIGNALKVTGNAIFGPVKLFWMAQCSWASANFFNDNSGAGLDLVPDDDHPGLLRPTNSWGCIGAVQWDITRKIFATAQYSYLRNYIPRYSIAATTPYDEQMRYGYTATANVVWKISSLFSTGVEYRHVCRRDEEGPSVSNNRVYAMLQMTF